MPSLTAQGDATEARLRTASRGRVVRVGSATGSRPVVTLPLEMYVARVLAGEGEPAAADAARQTLAVAIRTFALANLQRHGRDGYDLCDSTHCQVPRADNPTTRAVALATSGLVLTYMGRPAELFYSASCGGFSESAGHVWPGIDLPYLQAAADDVHETDPPWVTILPMEQIGAALLRAGFQGRLRDIAIEERNASGRVARLRLDGLAPAEIRGDQFRAAIGVTTLRSTAFALERTVGGFRFTGRGFGHGVGLCVIGAGRRAARGESLESILAHYYPGLSLTGVGGVGPLNGSSPGSDPSGPSVSVPPVPERGRRGILAQVPASSPASALELERMAVRAHDDLSRVLGVSLAPIVVREHDSTESFSASTGWPWWVGRFAQGTVIDLVPAATLASRGGLEPMVRTAVAELLLAQPLRTRPRWVRTGAARFFALRQHAGAQRSPADVRCPSDAELTLAVSAAAYSEAESRAEACFAREYARTRDWRAVR